ncbi:MAG: RluA family pseudouridine synthase [Verrucomicrobiota bacterium]
MPEVNFESLDIVREEYDWLIVSKPAPLLIHPTRPDDEFTLWHALQERYPADNLFLLNRLDRETSGLVLVSRNKETSSCLGKMMMHRLIHKRYLALVSGATPPNDRIDAPIGRKSDFEVSDIYVQQIIHPAGKAAQTHYRTLETRQYQGQAVSLLEIELLTGRMHQIRVHLQSTGHPVIGDKLYGPDPAHYLRVVEHGWSNDMLESLHLRRQALHASRLEFEWGGEVISIQSELPKDLQSFWDSCKL